MFSWLLRERISDVIKGVITGIIHNIDERDPGRVPNGSGKK
jgi:hypothetical protein